MFTPSYASTSRKRAVVDLTLHRVQETERILIETIHRLLAASSLAKNGIRLRHPDLAPPITVQWHGRTSRGGSSGLRFAVRHHAIKPETEAKYTEYRALDRDPAIGSHIGTRESCLQILAAHELAHWLQYSSDVFLPEGAYRPPHGKGFRWIYRILRDELRSWDQPDMEDKDGIAA